nr:MAG TPA: transcription elongation factor NusA [Caudoviricetes sp.]
MSKEIFEALRTLEKDRGISMDYMLEKINKAIVTGCKNNYGGNEEVVVNFDEERGLFDVNLMKTVVDEVENPGKEISLKDALNVKRGVQIGDQIAIKLNTKEFGRIAAQTARNIIRQGIKDGEKSLITQEFQSKQDSIVTALVERVDVKTGALTLRIGKAESTLPLSEQIGNEDVKEGDYIKVYLAEVKSTEKGPKIMISRSHPNFMRKLFESEVPEIADGTVEIKFIAREAGSRSKVALVSHNPNVDPIGSCIGPQKTRLRAIMSEVGGEKIDLIPYSENLEEFVAAALAPATVLRIEQDEENPNYCKVVVPANQFSLAIGNRGQNVRLAARLTGKKIDIRSDSEI